MGPLYWAPNQCIRQTSWTHPKKTSPVIAVIDNGNDIQESILEYYKVLTKNQIKIVTPALAPNYQFQYYTS